MGYKCAWCEKEYIRPPRRCSRCHTLYSTMNWEETPLREKDKNKLILSLNKRLGYPVDLIIDFLTNHCPDDCGSGHTTGQCIHTTECLNDFAEGSGWL